MLATQGVIDSLAERIERAYRRRRPGWRGECSTDRVWAAAAETLVRARGADRSLPLDPELYVAAQPDVSAYPDPWSELAADEAAGCYRARVNEIVKRLRGELAGEVRHAEGRVVRGEALAAVLLTRSHRLSPLGRFIVAHRAGRPALSRRFLRGASEQHQSCPLYRQACAGLLPADVYPVHDAGGSPAPHPTPAVARPRGQFHLN